MQIQDIFPEERDTLIVKYRRAIEGCGLTDRCPSIIVQLEVRVMS